MKCIVINIKVRHFLILYIPDILYHLTINYTAYYYI
jgi:hypothetical protein